jgi:4-amino-4-deoxy-L-arabinose transferase-like glycosyltransferase
MQRLSRLEILLLAAVILGAAVLRFAGLGRVPAGLYRDEAFYGLDALNVLRGQHAIYFSANNGREPMFIYLLALSIGALGRSPFAVRLPAALISLLTIPATFLMARELWGRRVGLISAAILTVTLWPVHLAHVGFRVGLLPLFAALTVWQAARGWRTQRTRHWVAAGVLYGLCFYTYLAVRFTPALIALFLIYAWFAHPRQRSAMLQAGLPFTLSTLIVVAPLAIYAAGHCDIFMGRGGQVTIFNPGIGGPNPWLTLARNVGRALGMFFWRGDFSARQNLPYRPVFDPVMSVFFLAGVVIAFIRARRDAASALALIWTAVMLLPTILAEDTPHFLRAVGVLPVVVTLPALALSQLSNFKENVEPLRRPLRFGIGYLIFGLVLATSLAFTGYDYFVRYANDKTVRFWFDDAGVQLAAEINRFTGTGWTGNEWIVPDRTPALDHRVFVDRAVWDGFVNAQFLVPHPSVVTLIKTGGELPAPPAGPTLLLLWPYEDWQRDLALLPRQSVIEFRDGALSKGDRDPEPIVTYLVVRAEPYSTPPAPLAQFRGGPQLVGAQVQGTRVRLTWYAPQKLDADYAVFVHALRDGASVAQHDGDPAGGQYPMSQWRPGDMVIDEHILSGAWDAKRDQVVVGLYRRDTGERLSVVDAADQVVSDSVPIAR